MKTKLSTIATVAAIAALISPAAFAQPATKLTTTLTEATINAVWCSALFLEESYFMDDLAADAETETEAEDNGQIAVYYEDMAYDLGSQLDDVMWEAGLPAVETEEIWSIFDDAAADFAAEDEDAYYAELDACEAAFNDNKLKLR